jgi:formylglycine-generating enzyme required for sulfatase activity
VKFLNCINDDDCNRWFLDQQPAHRVCLSSFWIGQTEVTNAQYQQCVDAGECVPGEYANKPDYATLNEANKPVIGASWDDAQDYVNWLSQTTGMHYALPTEAQWEYAARGPEALMYPWGNDFYGTRLNYCDVRCVNHFDYADTQYNDGYFSTAPVGTYSPEGDSWVGAADMAGNVWEWVEDWYSKAYYSTVLDGALDPIALDTGTERVVRGSAWNQPHFRAMTAYRLNVCRDNI